MNFPSRCARATTTLQLSLSSHNSRHCTCCLRPLIRSSRYSTSSTGAPIPSSSSWSQELNKQAQETLADSTRPREIPYQAKVANLVKLIGHIKLPVNFQSFPNGKHYAATLICEIHKYNQSCWIPVLFEGDLAHVASCHVKENDFVHVTGKLSMDPFPFVLDHRQWEFHILALYINFVEGFDDKAHDYSKKKILKPAATPDFPYNNLDNEKKSGVPDFSDNSSGKEIKGTLSEISDQDLIDGNIWTDVMKNPNQWVNYANDKSKGLVPKKYPDFKHGVRGTSLWLNSAPQWVLARIKNLDFDTSAEKQEVGNNDSQIEKLWKSVVENPDEWWDIRFVKEYKNEADFRHKKTGVRLWLKYSTEWYDKVVKDKNEETWKNLVENPNQWMNYDNHKSNGLVPKKHPDFKHRVLGTALWLDCAPKWVLARIKNLDFDTSAKKQEVGNNDSQIEKILKPAATPDFPDNNLDNEKKSGVPDVTDDSSSKEIKGSMSEISDQDLIDGNIWTHLIKNPNQWVNYADDKSKGLVPKKHPDFKHKVRGTSLWLNSAPKWVLARIKNLDFDTYNNSQIEKLWISVVENPDEWWDNRFIKKYKSIADFKHKKTGERLWLKSSPEWYDKVVKDKNEEAWNNLVENPNRWWDNRLDNGLNKKYEKAPDFKHKLTGERLWLNHSPDWVLSKLPPL